MANARQRSRRRVVAARRRTASLGGTAAPATRSASPLSCGAPPSRRPPPRPRRSCCRLTCALRSSSAASCSRKAPTPVSPSLRATSTPMCAMASQSSSRTELVPASASRTATSTRSRRSAAGAAACSPSTGSARRARRVRRSRRRDRARGGRRGCCRRRRESKARSISTSSRSRRGAPRSDIETFDLIAHSIGGYFSAFYAMAYPGRVRRLVLHGAVGIGPAPPPEERRPLGPFRGLWEARIPPFWSIEALWPARSQHGEGGLQGLHGHRVARRRRSSSANTGGNCSARSRSAATPPSTFA